VLGLGLSGGDTLVLHPCVPDEWPSYRLTWRVPGSSESYDVHVLNPGGCAARIVSASLDGRPVPVGQDELRLPLAGDGATHRLDVDLGPGGAGTGPARPGAG
jgi:cyclic beta-1,2-glucan synthetase